MHELVSDKLSGILYRRSAPQSPKAVLLLVHGLGAHSGRWQFLSDFFFAKNISTYAIELKGFGETKDLRGHIDSFNTYFDDIKNLHDIIVKENPLKEIFLLGESMGALLVFLMAALKPGLFDGLICISPAFKSRLKFSLKDYIRIYSSFLYNPKRQFDMPFDSSMATHDLEYQKVMDSDERECLVATSGLLVNTSMAQTRCKIFKDRVKIPTLFLLAGDDSIVDSKVSRDIFNSLKNPGSAIIEYPGMYHALSIEVGKEKVFSDILKWMEDK